jgi:hypothetical protein
MWQNDWLPKSNRFRLQGNADGVSRVWGSMPDAFTPYFPEADLCNLPPACVPSSIASRRAAERTPKDRGYGHWYATAINTFPRQWIHKKTLDLLDESLSMRCVSYQRKAGDYFFPELLFLILHVQEISPPKPVRQITHLRWPKRALKLMS